MIGVELEICDCCDGTGNLPCDTCNSQGVVSKPGDAGNMKCPDCEGEPCIECNGDGKV